MNEWLLRCLPVLITEVFFLHVRPIRLQNILYHVCFDNTDSLPGDDDDDDDDDTGDISTFDVEATHDEVAEILRKQVMWYNAIMSHVFSEISLYIHIHFMMLQWEIFQQVFLYANSQKTYFICRLIQYHNIYHINYRKHQMISIISL